MTRILGRLLQTRGRRLVVDVLLEPRDWWLGVFWSQYVSTAGRHCLRVYVCLLPCLPLRVSVVLWPARVSWPHDVTAGEDDDD